MSDETRPPWFSVTEFLHVELRPTILRPHNFVLSRRLDARFNVSAMQGFLQYQRPDMLRDLLSKQLSLLVDQVIEEL